MGDTDAEAQPKGTWTLSDSVVNLISACSISSPKSRALPVVKGQLPSFPIDYNALRASSRVYLKKKDSERVPHQTAIASRSDFASSITNRAERYANSSFFLTKSTTPSSPLKPHTSVVLPASPFPLLPPPLPSSPANPVSPSYTPVFTFASEPASNH